MWHFWLFFWILLAVVIILMYCCLVRAGKMDDEMEKAFRKLNEKRKDETELWQGEDPAYHDVIKLFKIYRAVNWQMQIKINQVKRRFHMEYGTDVDEFLDSIYQAGMDVERDLASEKERVEAINRSNQYLRLIDEAVDLMRRYHPQGERYYWVLYYSYLSSTKPENIDEILDKLEPHFPQYARVHRTTYFRWREQAFEAVGSILWGYEGESERVLKLVCEDYEEK